MCQSVSDTTIKVFYLRIIFEQTNGFTHEDVSFNWMPLDHVGGIVTAYVHDVYFWSPAD
ncbi:hypothetical protein ACEQPO_02535 [Bacillus sp. SL00103]